MNVKTRKEIFDEHKKYVIEYFRQNNIFYDFENEILNKDFVLDKSYMVEKYVDVEESFLLFWKKIVLRTRTFEEHQFSMSIHTDDFTFNIEYWTVDKHFSFILSDSLHGHSLKMIVPKKVTDGNYYIDILINKLFDEFEKYL